MSSDNNYMREYMLKRYHSRKSIAIKYLGGKCVKCGVKTGLQFDHKNRQDKSFTIAKLWSVSQERFWLEVKKCQLLCQDCHTAKTLKELGRKSARGTHGTISSYRYCKCKLCRAANALASKNYKVSVARRTSR